jgi:serine/threonine protein kinase
VGDYRFKKSNEIGAGYSSRVYRGTGKEKQEVAIKVIDMRKFSSSGLEMLDNEIQILRQLSHPNIIRLYYVYRTQTHTYLVTELCKGGDLLGFMTKKGRFDEDAAAVIMGEVLEGLRYLLQMGIIHRDIKPANILRSDKTWKIADFGFSICGREEVRTKQNVGTPLYMPIESLLKNVYSP